MTGTLREAYRVMRTIRTFEERVHDEFAAGGILGSVASVAGEEASATGVCLHLDDRDAIAGTRRGHGHCIAKGVDVKAMMAEIYGRRTGSCHGKGGSRHLADLAKGVLGGGPPLVCGAALAALRKDTGGVGVAFFGDGAGHRGSTLEALQLASAWNLPAVFVAETEATSGSWAVAPDNFADHAAGFGVPGVVIDGSDFFAVHEAAGEAIERARAGGGPTLLEVEFTRGVAPDCLERFRARVTDRGELAGPVLDAIDAEVARLIEDSVAEAKAAPKPTRDDLETDVYVSY
ncbi:thiamine pyrophosphate-dependent dehydrogenase E1 component subunit alpha [Amycolatopsis sp. cmx-4-68]|uniref:thiamine pyrophosphate-dependent dehydrogenase E1 component subunit alpha n=1 Tax=Amycolatopsis sp. cmx-4-68 TaxID=2790938 RepID=UPI00397A268D